MRHEGGHGWRAGRWALLRRRSQWHAARPCVCALPRRERHRPDGLPQRSVLTFLRAAHEINNTDAEGRLVLSDGVAHATALPPRLPGLVAGAQPDLVIDMATLTGTQRSRPVTSSLPSSRMMSRPKCCGGGRPTHRRLGASAAVCTRFRAGSPRRWRIAELGQGSQQRRASCATLSTEICIRIEARGCISTVQDRPLSTTARVMALRSCLGSSRLMGLRHDHERVRATRAGRLCPSCRVQLLTALGVMMRW